MKLTFTSTDLRASVTELQKSIVGLRVNQIYDVDHKTYLIKLQKPEHKAVLLMESAARLHTTDYQWPKNPAPSGFSMKLRKHLRNKRLESIKQLGVDRVVQMTFGSGEAQYHLILELYDRGNITLTDANYSILIILRPRKDGEDVRFAAHEVYPIDSFRNARLAPTEDQIREALKNAKPNLNLKKILNPLLDCGGGVVEHELTRAGLIGVNAGAAMQDDDIIRRLVEAANSAQRPMADDSAMEPKGYIIQRKEQRPALDGSIEEVALHQEFHPMLYEQHAALPHLEYPSFNQSCDEFFQQLESQRLQQRAVQQEKDALKKLENVRTDHSSRVAALTALQEEDTRRGQLIELNQPLVDAALLQVRTALAHQLDWREIEELLQEAQERDEPVACAIKKMSLATNTITMILSDPYDREESDLLLDSDEEREEGQESDSLRPTSVDIDLDMSAFANARRYYDSRRKAVTKVQKTMAASAAALKSATRKTKQTLKEVHTTTSINKVRKVHWFEKFLWFISSENYLVMAGHDQQQNEVIVKRHMKPNDVYVHADLHGASSVIIKNPSGTAVPPATLHQAGIMALCYSRAWAEKVVTSAWWVWGHQVSKSAPTGEYLTTGSFMVRGKKNFLPPSHLVYGFGFLFRLEESSIERHEDDRRVKSMDDPTNDVALRMMEVKVEDEVELEVEEEDVAPPQSEEEKHAIGEASDDAGEEGGEATEDEDDDTAQQFPDTVVEMTHISGDTFAVSASVATKPATTTAAGGDKPRDEERKGGRKQRKGKGKTNSTSDTKNESEPAEPKPKKPVAKEKVQQQDEEGEEDASSAAKAGVGEGGRGPLKRGQKSKLKKMKTKYKDQDEEERQMRMQILQSDGAKKEPKRQKGKKGKKQAAVTAVSKNDPTKTAGGAGPKTEGGGEQSETNKGGEETKEEKKRPKEEEEVEDDEDDETAQVSDDLAILKALTGQPLTEDELLYCVPVCAPYNALSNYKYKVKLTPGPGKKGKACKTAVSLFLSLKPTVGRECDLIRAVRDSDLARNVPGKVKVSAPNISKLRK